VFSNNFTLITALVVMFTYTGGKKKNHCIVWMQQFLLTAGTLSFQKEINCLAPRNF